MNKLKSDTLERLKRQREIINARIQKAESRQKTNARKQDARRKILIGAYYMDQAIKDGKYKELIQQIDSFLIRNSDRKLFELPVLNEERKSINKAKVNTTTRTVLDSDSQNNES